MPHLIAWTASAAVVLSAPFMGQVRAMLRSAFPGHFAAVVASGVGAAVVAAVAAALVRVRDRRAARYGAILGAVGVGAAYSLATASGTPDVDAVERVHFLEYGLISFLFYRAWRAGSDVSDVSIVALPIAAGVIVGTLEEWFQWFIPNRVGEARDVLLNLVAIGCGLAFSIGVDAPRAFAWRPRRGSAQAIGMWFGAAALVFALFVDSVHLGHEISDPGTPRFRSRYTSEELSARARDRVERWQTTPPTTLVRLSREDQYMDEGLWHIRRRNESWQANDFAAAAGENRILETFFAPVLDTPSYAAPGISRWPAVQREDAERRRPPGAPEYISHAEPYPVLAWPRGAFWLAAGLCAAAPALAGLMRERRAADFAALTV